jgi:hypothetical protein
MKPPVGRLAFRKAEIPDPWTEPLDCTQEGEETLKIFELCSNKNSTSYLRSTFSANRLDIRDNNRPICRRFGFHAHQRLHE